MKSNIYYCSNVYIINNICSDIFALEVLKEFTTLFDFTNKTFDESLRHYLNSFRLPGEAQKIDRSTNEIF